MIFQNITKNETLNSTKIAFRVITIIAIAFFTFLNWFSYCVITVVMIRNSLANKSHDTSLYRTSFLNTVNFLIIFSTVFSTQWLIVLCSSFENHTWLLSYRSDKYLPWTAPHRFSDLNRYSKLDFGNNSPLSA